MIDDTPWARLTSVILFAGFIFACAPIAYYLADVVRYPINHEKIKTLQTSYGTQYDYILTLAVHTGQCSTSETSSWAGSTARTSLSEVFRSPASKDIVYLADPLSSKDPAAIIHSLDGTRPTPPSHEMDVVIVATPDVVSVKSVYLGPTRRSVIFVPCTSHATVRKDLSLISLDLHAVLSSDRSKDTDVVSVPQYRISMTLLDAAPLDRHNSTITWSGATMKKSMASFLTRLDDAVTGLDIDTQIVRFVKISDKVHKSCGGGKDCPASAKTSAKKSRKKSRKKSKKKDDGKKEGQEEPSGRTEEEGKDDKRDQKTSPPPLHFVTPKDLQRIRSLLSDGFNLESGSLSPLVSPLHLILYVPPPAETPLYIVPDEATGRALEIVPAAAAAAAAAVAAETNRLGFYVPRYGGVVVWNLATTDGSGEGEGEGEGCSKKDLGGESESSASRHQCQPSDSVLDIVSDLWVSQLRHLLGVATTTPKSVVFLRSPDGIAEWELDALIRGRLSHFSSLTAKSLSALSSLVQDMSHMSVPVLVGESVAASLEEYDLARRKVLEGDVTSALAHMSNAFNHARLAEMEPSMAPLRYFPPVHLAAVYLPLIVPLLIPIVMGLKNGVKEWREEKGKKKF